MVEKQKQEFVCMNSWYKWGVGMLIIIILGLSATFIGVELGRNEEPTDESVEMLVGDKDSKQLVQVVLKNDTINSCSVFLNGQVSKTKDYTGKILLYTSFIIIVTLSLIGLFVALFRILQTEAEERKAINKVALELHKEEQMTRISSEKKDND